MPGQSLKGLLGRIIPSLDGWCSTAKAEAIYDYLDALAAPPRPLAGVEIGVFAGRSLVAAALALKANDAGFVVGIDPYVQAAELEGDLDPNHLAWLRTVDYVSPYRNCLDALARHSLHLWGGLLRARAETVAHLFGPLDYLHIDGNHSELASLRDVSLYLPLLREGGVLVMDDTHWASLRAALSIVESRCKPLRVEETWAAYTPRTAGG